MDPESKEAIHEDSQETRIAREQEKWPNAPFAKNMSSVMTVDELKGKAGAPLEELCKTCFVCKRADLPLLTCSRCKSREFRYCGKECQKVDWKLHKKICIVILSGDSTISECLYQRLLRFDEMSESERAEVGKDLEREHGMRK